jgi:hypothetical protein
MHLSAGWQDWLYVALVCSATLLVFGSRAQTLGFYSDDAGFLVSLPRADLEQTLRLAAAYVPGRNLHIVWQQLLFILAGSSPTDLGKLHYAQAGLDTLAVGLFYLLSRQIGLPPVWSFVASVLFAFFPNHDETHFWLSSAPMNVLSTIFVLGYAIIAIRIMRRRATGNRSPFGRSLAEFVLFVFALFTYDQTVLVLLLILGVRFGTLLHARAYARAGTLALLYGACFLFYIFLKINPSSGPTLTNVSLSHIKEMIQTSVSVIAGQSFRSVITDALQTSTRTDQLVAALVSIGFLAASAVGVLRVVIRRYPVDSSTPLGAVYRSGDMRIVRGRPMRYAMVSLVAAAFIFLAYAPNYIWFISPRHNFLPSVGLALGIGALGALIAGFIGTQMRVLMSAGLTMLLVAVMGMGVYVFVLADLSQKTSWIDSYVLRSQLYDELATSTTLANKSVIIFENFPTNIGSAPFFVQENYQALDYLYPQQADLTLSGISSISTDRGYFTATELDRFGVAARFEVRDRVVHLGYKGLVGDRLQVEIGGDGFRASDLYSVVRDVTPPTNTPDGDALIRSARLQQRAGESPLIALDLDLHTVRVPDAAVLGLIFRSRQGQADVPVSTRTASGERVIVPVVVPTANELGPAPGRVGLTIDLRTLAVPAPDSVGLYLFSDEVPLLLEQVPVE